VKNKLNWLEAALVLAPFLLVLAFWNQLPARVPIHWNLAGEIDRWSSKSSILLMPLTSCATVALLHLIPWLDPKLRRKRSSTERMNTVLPIFRLLFATFFFFTFLLVLCASLGAFLSVGRIITTSVLLFLAGIGNYLGKLRPNYFIGLRTPWTLESGETWRATHRLGGRLFFFGSIGLLLAEFLVPEPIFIFLSVTAALLLVVWSFVYSWRHFHMSARPDQSSP